MKAHVATVVTIALAVFLLSSVPSVYPDLKSGRVPLGTLYLQGRPEWPYVLSVHVLAALIVSALGCGIGVLAWRLLGKDTNG